jgi:phosphotriesterase-related protein
MQNVNTVTGPIGTSELGKTLMHEHIFTPYTDLRTQYPWDEDAIVSEAVTKLKEVRSQGFSSIVDMTIFGMGRNAVLVRRVAEESGMNIIMATGVYISYEMPNFFKMGRIFVNPTFMEEFFLREAEEGIADTGIKPAVIKCSSDRPGVTKDVEVGLRVAARVHRQTGLLLATHAYAKSEQGVEQQRVFAEEGVDLTRVMIGHVGDTPDLDYSLKLLSKGSIIGMDRFGWDHFLPLNVRAANVAELCRRGFAKQITISHDIDCVSDTITPEIIESVPDFKKNRRLTYLSDVAIPALLEAGVSQTDIDTILIENPCRIFETAGEAY